MSGEEKITTSSGGESSSLILVSVVRDGMNKWALWDIISHSVKISNDIPGSSLMDALDKCACILSIEPIEEYSKFKKPLLTLQQFFSLYIELTTGEDKSKVLYGLHDVTAMLGIKEEKEDLDTLLNILDKACGNTPLLTIERMIEKIPPKVVSKPLESSSFIIRIRGLSMAITESDIREFFAPLRILSVLLVGTCESHPTFSRIEGFVEFASEDDAETALKRNGTQFKGLTTEIYLSSASEREGVRAEASTETTRNDQLRACVKHMKKQDPLYRGFLRMRGLPYDANEQDILTFFDGYDIVKNSDSTPSVYILRNSENRPDGTAYVEFEKESVALVACNARNKHTMGRRYIELFVCSRGECVKALNNIVSRSMSVASGNFTIVRLRGLPWRVTAYAIMEFFAPLRIAPNGIHIVLNREHRSSGEAYIEFMTSDDAIKALQRNRRCIGKRYIEVFKTSQQEYDSASRFFADNHHDHRDYHSSRPYDSHRDKDRDRDRDRERGWSPTSEYNQSSSSSVVIPPQSQPYTASSSSSSYYPPPPPPYQQPPYPPQQYIPQPYAAAAAALSMMSGPSLMYGAGAGGGQPVQYMSQPIQQVSASQYLLQQTPVNPSAAAAAAVNLPPVNPVQTQSSSVRVWNLPGTAGQKDLENVFAGFNFTSIRMHTDEKGRWCATITFKTPEEAANAITARHLSIVGSSRICVQPEPQ